METRESWPVSIWVTTQCHQNALYPQLEADVKHETAGCDSWSCRLIGDKFEVFAEGAARNLDPLTVTIIKIIFRLFCTLHGMSLKVNENWILLRLSKRCLNSLVVLCASERGGVFANFILYTTFILSNQLIMHWEVNTIDIQFPSLHVSAPRECINTNRTE